MLVLLLWRSFFIYTALAIVVQIIQNVIVAALVDKKYPYLKRPATPLKPEKKKDLYHRVYATFLQKVSITVTNATDNLVISAFVGMIAVGLYNNYYLIVSTVRGFLSGVFGAMTASLGNLFVTDGKERSAFIFRSLNLAGNILTAICSVCFLVLFQPFIILWAGEDYLLDMFTVWTIVLNFTTIYLQSMVQIYRDATGLTVVGKYRSVINAAMNLVVSLILVKPLGMAGVFLGSVIARLTVNWWFDAWVLHRKGFGCSPAGYYLRYLLSLVLIVAAYLLTETLCRGLSEATWLNLIVKAAVSVGVTGGLYLAVYGRSKEMRYLVEKGGHGVLGNVLLKK
jgi:O-antigen/teichoic acid export membrane protein